jgi:hypothetical protein
MRLVGGFHCFVWGCLAASLYAGAANPNRDVNYLDVGTALADPDDLSATRASPDVRPDLAEPEVNVRSLAASDTCLADEDCIDQYLWSIYERTRKLDTIKVQELMRVTVKKKGHTRTVMKGVTKLADEDFTWKDPQAAQRAGMSLVDYVIGGIDRDFKVRLYHLLRALDEAGLAPGLTSGFRDNYRQSMRPIAHTMVEAGVAALATGLQPIWSA